MNQLASPVEDMHGKKRWGQKKTATTKNTVYLVRRGESQMQVQTLALLPQIATTRCIEQHRRTIIDGQGNQRLQQQPTRKLILAFVPGAREWFIICILNMGLKPGMDGPPPTPPPGNFAEFIPMSGGRCCGCCCMGIIMGGGKPTGPPNGMGARCRGPADNVMVSDDSNLRGKLGAKDRQCKP